MSSPLIKKTLLSLLFFAFTSLSHAKLQILSTDILQNPNYNFGDGLLDYVAITPKNASTSELSFTGDLILAHPNQYACEPIKTIRPYRYDPDTLSVPNPIVIAAWGDCNLTEKVKNAELGGARMIILTLGPNMPVDHPSLRELAISSSIEVLAIKKIDGDSLIQNLQGNTMRRKDNPDSIIKMNYSADPERNVHYPKVKENVVVDFYFITNDLSKSSYIFLTHLKDLLSEFDGLLKFSPRYIIRDSGTFKENWNDLRCLSGLKYCDANWNDTAEKGLQGNKAVMEALRQTCLRDLEDQSTTKTLWWKYMDSFADECVNINKTTSPFDQNPDHFCYKNVFEKAKIPSDIADTVHKCMVESFGLWTDEDIYYLFGVTKENSKLKSEVAAMDLMHVGHSPTLYVDGVKYKGSLTNKTMVKEFVLSQLPDNLLEKVNTKKSEEENPLFVFFAIILGSVVLLDIVVMQFMRRRN